MIKQFSVELPPIFRELNSIFMTEDDAICMKSGKDREARKLKKLLRIFRSLRIFCIEDCVFDTKQEKDLLDCKNIKIL